MTVQDLLEIGGIGDKYCSEIVDKMAELGIKLNSHCNFSLQLL